VPLHQVEAANPVSYSPLLNLSVAAQVANGRRTVLVTATLCLRPNSCEVLQVSLELLRHNTIVNIQAVFSRRDQSQIGQNFEMMRQRWCGNGVLGVHLAAEQLIMLRNVRVNREPIRISESTCDLRNLVVLHSSHID
jgi:hypothetical protein